jgi:hypothetical protein
MPAWRNRDNKQETTGGKGSQQQAASDIAVPAPRCKPAGGSRMSNLSSVTRLALVLIQAASLCVAPGLALESPELPDAPRPSEALGMLASLPAGASIINYRGGQLTIVAQNASFEDVLRVTCRQTGTVIEIPPGTDERVAGLWGPGPAREVIASFLNGSQFNYVMMGSENDSNRLARIVLSRRPKSSPVKTAIQRHPAPTQHKPAYALRARKALPERQQPVSDETAPQPIEVQAQQNPTMKDVMAFLAALASGNTEGTVQGGAASGLQAATTDTNGTSPAPRRRRHRSRGR